MPWEVHLSFRKLLCIGCVVPTTPVPTLLMGVRAPPQVGYDWERWRLLGVAAVETAR